MLKCYEIEDKIREAVRAAAKETLGQDTDLTGLAVELEIPKIESHGDLSSNYAMRAARIAKKSPRAIGGDLVEKLKVLLASGELACAVEDVRLEGPGFVNFHLSRKALVEILDEISLARDAYGRSTGGSGTKVLLEFVSANPTGPLTIAHGRQAALGDSLARILRCAGYDVKTEYYNNDEGVQIETLGKSLYARIREEEGKSFDFPENGYRGEYIRESAKRLIAERGGPEGATGEERIRFCSAYQREELMKGIQRDLEVFGVGFDRFFSQEALGKSGEVEKTLEDLKSKNAVYEKDGAVWLRTTDHGDDKDRVIKKSDGNYTYLMPDIAYHRDKFRRGFDLLIDILGPDHHGYIARLKASQKALGNDPEAVHVLIAQLVSLFEGNKQLKMSTRAGEFITLRELVENVGRDAARFFFLVRKFDSHLDFDLELAKSQTSDNPVFYIQYVHARICSIHRTAEERGIALKGTGIQPELLKETEETRLLKFLRHFPKSIEAAARQHEPHVLVEYLQNLAAQFHQFYQKHRVIADEPEVMAARVALVDAIKIVIHNGLALLGVSAPEKM